MWTCGRTKTVIFECDDVSAYYLRMLCKGYSLIHYFYPFSVFMWASEYDSNTLLVIAFFFFEIRADDEMNS